MNYEKFKAEVQEYFPIVWEFSDESDESFNRVGAGGCGGGSHKRYVATTDQPTPNPVAIVWDGNREWPVSFMARVEVRTVKANRTIRFQRRTIAECVGLLEDFISSRGESLGGPPVTVND